MMMIRKTSSELMEIENIRFYKALFDREFMKYSTFLPYGIPISEE